jgi:hypothetical protein
MRLVPRPHDSGIRIVKIWVPPTLAAPSFLRLGRVAWITKSHGRGSLGVFQSFFAIMHHGVIY